MTTLVPLRYKKSLGLGCAGAHTPHRWTETGPDTSTRIAPSSTRINPIGGTHERMGTAVATKGLEGIVATNSSICWIDGDAGVLAYRGIDIHELASKSTFEETAYLLWNGTLPTPPELDAFTRRLTEARELPPQIIDL